MSKIKASKEAKKALKRLKKWEEKEPFYNVFLHGLEVYDDFEEMEYLDQWFGFNFKAKYEDRFLAFANDGTGGELALWFYPNLEEEPPVIFSGSEGQTNLIANSMTHFLCLLSNGKLLDTNNTDDDRTPENLWHTIYNFELEDLAEDYDISIKKAGKKLEKSALKFKNFISKKIVCRDNATMFKDLSKHPNYTKWVEKVLEENLKN